jgi:hypothetical protein
MSAGLIMPLPSFRAIAASSRLRDALNAQTRRAKQSQGQPPTGGPHGQN